MSVPPEEAPSTSHFPRSIVALCAVVAGFIIARAAPAVPVAVPLGAAGFLCAVAAKVKGWPCRLALVAAALCFGFGWFTLRIFEQPTDSLAALLPPGEQLVKVEGIVLDTPRVDVLEKSPLYPHVPDGPRGHVDLRVTGLVTDSVAASGLLWVRAGGEAPAQLKAGDRVRVTGKIEFIGAPKNPGEPDRRLWAAQDGRIGWLRAPSAELIERVGEDGGVYSAWLRMRAALRDRAHMVLLGDERNEGRAVLGALILGEEDRALRDIRGSFNRLGLAHVLSISGFHLTVMAGVVLLMLRLWGDLGRFESIITGALVLLYLSILPFNAPVWRSGLMVLGLLVGDALGRRYDRLTILGWIAVLLLLFRPMDAWSMGFQLSFGLVALLVKYGELVHGRVFGVPLRGTVHAPHYSGWLASSIKRLISTSLLCGVAATPIVAYHTGLVSPAAVFSSILLVPPIAALLIAGYLVLLLGVLAPPLSGFASDLLGKLSDWTAALVRWFDAIPGTSLSVPQVSLALALAATCVILYWFIRGHRRDIGAWAAAAIVCAWTIAEFRLSPALPSRTLVRIDTLAVGDGTCHLIRSGRDAMLWDCGSLDPGVGELLVPRAARALGAYRVPTVLVTHPNLDHFNGLVDIAEPLGVKLLITGEAVARRAADRPHGAEAYLLSELQRRGVEVKVVSAGDRIDLGDVSLEFISPEPGASWPDDNDWSLVARVVPAGGAPDEDTLALMTGDIEAPAIKSIRDAHPGMRALVVEAPHHGSAREAAAAFVAGLGPAVVLQSTGPRRALDPRWDAVRAQTKWYCTTLDGAAWVEVNRDGSVRSGSIAR